MYKTKLFQVDFSDLADVLDGMFPTSTPEKLYTNPFEIAFPGIVKESINIKTTPYGKIGEYTKFIITGKDKKGKDKNTEYICYKVDTEGCTAKYEDGILYITLKQKEVKENKIKVE
jgi:HSP20 family molecular chaperone IbpA